MNIRARNTIKILGGLFAIVSTFIVFTHQSYAVWTDRSTAAGTGATSIKGAGISSNGQTMIIVGDSGFVKTSTDGGASWTDRNVAAGAGTTTISAAAIGPSGEMIIVGDSGFIKTSTNGGASWTDRNAASGIGTTSLRAAAIGPTGVMFVVGDSSFAKYSGDGGASWTVANIAIGGFELGAAVGPSGKMFAVATDGKSVSFNGGVNWTATGTNNSDLYSAAIGSNGTFIAGGTGISYLQTSTDGTNWSDRAAAAGLSTQNVRAVDIGPSGEMYAGGTAGFFKESTDGGASWTDLSAASGIGANDVRDIEVDSSGNFIVVGTAGYVRTYTANTAPTITVNPSVTYGSYTRTGPNNPNWSITFSATDTEQSGGNQLTWYVHTGANRTLTQVVQSTTTGNGSSYGFTVSYNSTGMNSGTNNLYLSLYDGSLYSAANPLFTVLRDDVAPTATTSISTNPATVTSNSYTVTFTPNDAISTNTNEISYKICTANDTCASPLTGGTGTATSGQAKTTGTITDTLNTGANTRWIRTCDGANNCTNTQFTVTKSAAPTGVTTNAETNLGSYKVTFNGTANPNGSQAHGYFRYYTGSAPDCTQNSGGVRVPSSSSLDYSLGSGSAPVSFHIDSELALTRQTQYWYCAYAYNDAAGINSPGTPAAAGYDTFTTPDGPASGCDAPSTGNLTVSVPCTFPQTDADGVDAGGSGTTNTASLILASGGQVTLLPGQIVGVGSKQFQGGSFVIGNGSASVLLGAGVWIKDTDNDGIIDNPVVKAISRTKPTGYIRRNYVYTLPTYNTSTFNYASKIYNATTNASTYLDCDSTNGNIFQTVANVVTDQDNDGYKTAAAASTQCVGPTSTINTRTYYKDSTGAYSWIASVQKDLAAGTTVGQGGLPQGVGMGGVVQADITGTRYIYQVGGYINNGSSNGNTIVYKSTVDSSGNMGAFTSAGQNQLPVGTAINTAAVGTAGGNTYIYKIGGYSGTGGYQNSVYKAQLDASGNVGAWSGMTSLPATIGYSSAASVNISGQTYIYLVGGIDGSNGTTTVYKATLDASGNTGTWTSVGQGTLPQSVSGEDTFILNSGGTNYLYVVGGFTGTSTASTLSTIYRAPIDASGNIGSFSTAGQGQLPQPLYNAKVTVLNIQSTNYLYVLGGYNGGNQSTVYIAPIDASGNVGTLTSSGQAPLPQTLYGGGAVSLGGTGGPYVGYIGGSNSTYQSTVYRMSTTSSMQTDCQDNPSGAPCAPVNGSGTNGTNPTATAATTSQINLAWGVNSAGGAVPAVNSYDVYKCGLNNSGCTGSPTISNVSSATFSASDTGLACSTSPSYYYKIVAKNTVNGNTSSPIISGVTSTCCVPNTTVYADNDGQGGGAAPIVSYKGGTAGTGYNTGSTASVTINKPAAGVESGVVLIASITFGGSSIVLTPPAGWNLINRVDNNSPTVSSTAVYYHVAGGAEPASYTWSASPNVTAFAGNIVAYDNVNSSSPIDTSQVTVIGNNNSLQTAFQTSSGITTSYAYELIVVVAGAYRSSGVASWTPPTGMTERADTNNTGGRMVSISDVMQNSAGATGVKSATLSSSGYGGVIIFGLRSNYATTTQCVANNTPTGPWSINANDCNDNTMALYQNLNAYIDGDGDGVVGNSTTPICSGAALPSGFNSNPGTDCNDSNASYYQNLTCYNDLDQDGSSVNVTSTQCGAPGVCPTGYMASLTNPVDCYDSNANAKPGQTAYYNTYRGVSADAAGNTGSSYDYNCNNSVDYNGPTPFCYIPTGRYSYIGGTCSAECSSVPMYSADCGSSWYWYGGAVNGTFVAALYSDTACTVPAGSTSGSYFAVGAATLTQVACH